MLLLGEEGAFGVAATHGDATLSEVTGAGDGGVVDAKARESGSAHIKNAEHFLITGEHLTQR